MEREEVFLSDRERFSFCFNVAAVIGAGYLLKILVLTLCSLVSWCRAYILAPRGISRVNLLKYGSWASECDTHRFVRTVTWVTCTWCTVLLQLLLVLQKVLVVDMQLKWAEWVVWMYDLLLLLLACSSRSQCCYFEPIRKEAECSSWNYSYACLSVSLTNYKVLKWFYLLFQVTSTIVRYVWFLLTSLMVSQCMLTYKLRYQTLMWLYLVRKLHDLVDVTVISINLLFYFSQVNNVGLNLDYPEYFGNVPEDVSTLVVTLCVDMVCLSVCY